MSAPAITKGTTLQSSQSYNAQAVIRLNLYRAASWARLDSEPVMDTFRLTISYRFSRRYESVESAEANDRTPQHA